jgi:hypothetical protein
MEYTEREQIVAAEGAAADLNHITTGNRNCTGKCARHFELKKIRNRKRNKAARKSRQINRKQ